MELINANNINLHNGSKDILIDGNFRILEGEKYGLIGPNGVGKTTLIRILLNEEEIDKGSLKIRKNLNIGYLPQMPRIDDNQTIEEFLLAETIPLEIELKKIEDQMSTADNESMADLLDEYQNKLDQFESIGGYDSLDNAVNHLKKLGLDNHLDQKMKTLSGGEQSLIFFAKALLVNPDLLILDEPGNHLDYLGLAWLEAFINSYSKAIIIVTHNRYLLNKICKNLLSMRNGKLVEFHGDYSSFRLEELRGAMNEQSEYEASMRLREKLEKKIKHLQTIAMNQYNPPAKIMSELGGAKKRLSQEISRNLEKPDIINSKIKLRFGEELSKSDIAMQVNNFNFSWDEKQIFKEASMEIKCGEKVALVGPNGSGKSTLISALINNNDWDGGSLRIGPSQRIGYLSQKPKFSESAVSIEDEIRSWGAISKDEATSIALNFLFTYKDLEKRLDVLSGGEKNRLQLAHLMYDKKNFLILDEPTNHMDIESRELIEKAINLFRGTILVVSHDRYFLDQLVERVVEIDELKLKSYEGNFSDFFKEKYPVLPRLSGKIDDRAKERLSIKSECNNQTVDIEKRISEAENEKAQLEKKLEECYLANELQKGRKISNKLEQLNYRIENLYKKWEVAL